MKASVNANLFIFIYESYKQNPIKYQLKLAYITKGHGWYKEKKGCRFLVLADYNSQYMPVIGENGQVGDKFIDKSDAILLNDEIKLGGN